VDEHVDVGGLIFQHGQRRIDAVRRQHAVARTDGAREILAGERFIVHVQHTGAAIVVH